MGDVKKISRGLCIGYYHASAFVNDNYSAIWARSEKNVRKNALTLSPVSLSLSSSFLAPSGAQEIHLIDLFKFV